MAKHLFMFSVGPVMEFIQASRRSRDLHWSSNFIEKMALGAAEALKSAVPGVEFIAPPLTFTNGKVNQVPTSDRVLLALPGDADLSTALKAAEDGAYAAWDTAIREAEAAYGQLGINTAVWTEQKAEKRVEFFSAWVPLADDDSDFQSQRTLVERLLDAREEFCDFVPAPRSEQEPHGHRVPKSSLDGRRESVLRDATEIESKARQAKQIKKGEQLDLPGLVKRLTPDQSFPAGSRIAVDPFIRGVYKVNGPHAEKRAAVDRIKGKLREFSEAGRDGFFSTTGMSRYADFPYDGHQLYPDRLEAMKNEYPHYDREGGEDLELPTLLGIVKRASINPQPYLAVIACDGDGMGTKISGAKNPAENSAISTRLQNFAASVKGIVEGDANGSAIFAGGDDVLAFVPLDRMLDCVEELQKKFRANVDGCTLSVGVAIVHMLTPMAGEMIAHAHEAESDAKGGRWEFNDAELERLGVHALAEAKKERGNSVSFHLYKRSGAPIKVRMAWPTPTNGQPYDVYSSPVTRMKGWVHLLRKDLIPDRLAYELRTLADHYMDRREKKPLSWVMADLLHAEVTRLLGKKQKGEHDTMTKDVRDRILARLRRPERLANETDEEWNNRELAFAHQAWLALSQLAEEIIIARMLLTAYDESGEDVKLPKAPPAQNGGA